MDQAAVVAGARRSLGRAGGFVPGSFTEPVPVGWLRDAVRSLEAAGYQTAWSNEPVGGKDVFTQLAVLMAATERITFATGIANIWSRLPQITNAASAQLAEAYPDRFVLGLGVGYPQQAQLAGREFGRPLATMRAYLERMHDQVQPPPPDTSYATVVAANGPKMVALAAELADGIMPAGMPPGFTARARAQLGPEKLLIVGLTAIVDADAARARATARESIAASNARSPARSAALAEFGFTAEDVAGVSDRLVDALAGHGRPEAIAALAQAHLDAGADHVAFIPGGADVADRLRQLEQLAPAVTALG